MVLFVACENLIDIRTSGMFKYDVQIMDGKMACELVDVIKMEILNRVSTVLNVLLVYRLR